ncbi:MAG: MFS transporter [Blautia sp.]|nr:MFS transporter [Blautia sp.]
MKNSHILTSKADIKKINIAAILSVFLFSGAGTFMNAAVQTMIEAWPQLSPTMVRMVTSLPALISLPVTILAGSLAGKKLSFRFCGIFGTGLILVAGIAPFFLYKNWWLILFFRALVGIGVGLVAMRNSLILKSVSDEQKAAVIGYGSSLMNAGGMLAGPIVGAMAVLGWRVPFLFDLLALIPILMMVFWLKEPKTEDTGNATAGQGTVSGRKEAEISVKASTGKMDWRVIFYIVAQFLMTTALYPILSGMSSYLAANHLGTSVTAGWSNAVYCLAGALINIVLDPVERKLGKNLFPFMCVMYSIGMGLIVFVQVVPVIFTGAILAGISFNTLMSIYQLYNGKVADLKIATLTSTIIIAALNLGNFMSVYYINLCHALFHRGSDIESAYFGSMLVYLIFAVVSVIFKVAPKEYYQKKTAKV